MKTVAATVIGITWISFAATIAAQTPTPSPGPTEPTCAVMIRRMQAIVGAPQRCQRDADCTLFAAGPMFQSVTTASARRVEPLRGRWAATCDQTAVAQPESSHAACIDRRCARVLDGSGRVVYGPLPENLGL